MRAFLAGCIAILLVTMISGCFLISATGEYDVRNDTNEPIRVTCTDSVSADEHVSDPIDSQVTLRLASQRFLEADAAPPSYYFATFVIQVESGGSWQTTYTRPDSAEAFDEEWEAQEVAYRRNAYVFSHSLAD